MSINILDALAYGTELRGSCGDGKEVRCHDSRTRPSTARGKDHHSFSANRSAVGSSMRFAPLFWLVAQPVFEQVAGSYRNARLGSDSEAFPAPFDGGLFPKRHKRYPAQGYLVFK